MSVRASQTPAPTLPTLRRPRLLAHIDRGADGARARLRAPQLEARLLEGEQPRAGGLLAVRARQLVRPRNRMRLANAVERLYRRPRRKGISAAIPVDQRALELALPALGQLAQALRGRESVRARGVVLTRILLAEPSSPLYRPAYPAALYEAAREALLALVPEGIGSGHLPRAVRSAVGLAGGDLPRH